MSDPTDPERPGCMAQPIRDRAKRDNLETVQRLLSARQGQNLAVTVLCVPYWLDSG